MLLKNVASQGIYVYVYNALGPKTGDASNITGNVSIDGAAASPLGTTHPTEIGGGLYWQPLAQAETNGNMLGFSWSSTTSGVSIDALIVTTSGVNLPAVAYAASGGLLTYGSGTGQINPGSGKVPATLASTDVTGNVNAAVQSIASGAVTATAIAGAALNGKGDWLTLTTAVATSNTAQTVGDALNAARAQGFGKWVLSGTTLTLYAADGTTAVRTFTLDSASLPTSRT